MDFNKTVVTTETAQGKFTELNIYLTQPDQLKSYIELAKEQAQRTGVFSTLLHFSTSRFNRAIAELFAFNLTGVATNVGDCCKAASWALKYHLLYSIVFFLIILAVISLTCGSICRIAALQLARDERPGLYEALKFGTQKFTSFFSAPLAPVIIIIFIGLLIFLLGLIGNIPKIGELIIAIFMILALVAGALIAVVLIGTVAGFNLMFPAVAYDGSDCFDAISRSFSYVYAKPWHMGFYTAIAVVYGAICYIFVRFFAFLLLFASRWTIQLGVFTNSSADVNKLTTIWPQPTLQDLVNAPTLAATNWSESIAAFLIYLFLLVIKGLVIAFIISFYFSANTIIYSLMRNRVDNTALEDIYMPFNEAKTEPIPIEPEAEQSQSQPESESKDD
ncbi:MAG: hypothetical protein ACYS8Y_00210 [Planctomycetota bacterium]